MLHTLSPLLALTIAHAVIPKQGTVFELRLPISTTDALSFEIFGDNFAHRSYDRVSRKWKNGSGSGCVNVDLQRYI